MHKHFSIALGIALGMAILFPIATAQAQTTVVVPPAPQAAQSVETDATGPNPLLVSGLVSFGVSYGSSVIVASQSNHPGDDRLYVPVLGPWLDLNDRGGCSDINNKSCDNETTNKVLLVIDGVVQGAGVLAFVGGILEPNGTTTTRTTVSDTKVHFAPVSYGPAAPGMAAFGHF